MNNSLTSIVTVAEFVHFYVLIESKIGENIDLRKKEIKRFTESLSEAEKKLIETRGREQMNQHQISNDSVFTIHVHEADEIEMGPWRVRLRAGEQETHTDNARDQYNTLYWTDKFTFKIFTGEETLLVDIVDADVEPHNEDPNEEVISRIKRTIGSVKIPISSLRDQQKKTDYFRLDEGRGRMNLSLQWIWSMTKYLEDVVKKYQETLTEARFDLQNLEGQANRLQEPFPDKIDSVRSADSKNIPGLAQIDKMMDKFEPYSIQIDEMGARLIGQTVKWNLAAYIATLVFLGLTVFAMFIRPDFVNLMVALTAAYYFAVKEQTAFTLKMLGLAVVVTEVFDFVWFMSYFGPWMGGINQADGAENGVRRFALFMALINFIAKVPVAIVYWRHSCELRG